MFKACWIPQVITAINIRMWSVGDTREEEIRDKAVWQNVREKTHGSQHNISLGLTTELLVGNVSSLVEKFGRLFSYPPPLCNQQWIGTRYSSEVVSRLPWSVPFYSPSPVYLSGIWPQILRRLNETLQLSPASQAIWRHIWEGFLVPSALAQRVPQQNTTEWKYSREKRP